MQTTTTQITSFAALKNGTYRAVQTADSDYLTEGDVYTVSCKGKRSAYFSGSHGGTTISRVAFLRVYRPLVLVEVSR